MKPIFSEYAQSEMHNELAETFGYADDNSEEDGNMNKVTIKYKGQTISCYGKWRWDSNCLIAGEWPDNTELEEIFIDGANNWTDAVHKIVDAPALKNCKIIELQSC